MEQSEDYKYHYDEEGNLCKKVDRKGEHWQYTWYASGHLQSVVRPDGREVSFEYDALGRRTAKIFNHQITRWLWDGNTPLHEWSYPLADRPREVPDAIGLLHKDREEPVPGLTTWVFDEGSFRPTAKITPKDNYSIISDYIGRAVQAYDASGKLVWRTDYDIYGDLTDLKGDRHFVPFRQAGQYEDSETGLYYNRFRYYDPALGTYLSKDPIGLEGGNPNLYGYVFDSNSEMDVFGLDLSQQMSFKEAFRRAKQQLRIPNNVNTPKSIFVYDGQYENRTVWAFDGEHKGKYIIMHQEDKFQRGAHLHTADGIKGDPSLPGKYNQHSGHIPENIDGLSGVKKADYK